MQQNDTAPRVKIGVVKASNLNDSTAMYLDLPHVPHGQSFQQKIVGWLYSTSSDRGFATMSSCFLDPIAS